MATFSYHTNFPTKFKQIGFDTISKYTDKLYNL